MQISVNKVVAIDFRLTDEQGELIDQTEADSPLYYVHGTGQLVPGVERELEGRTTGDSFTITVEPEDAFGFRDEELVRQIPKDMIENIDDLEPGIQLELKDDDGDTFLFTVIEVNADDVVADGNHPLADICLTFDITVREIRDATEEEIRQGQIVGVD